MIDPGGWLTQARDQQDALMVATCTITTGNGMVWDPAQGKDRPAAGATVYTGRCSLLQGNTQAKTVPAGGQPVTLGGLILKVPWTVTGIQPGMTAVVQSPDPDAQPATVTIIDVGGGDMVTCRRLVVHREETS